MKSSLSHYINAIERRLYHLERKLILWNTPARHLKKGHLETFELFDIIRSEGFYPKVIYDIGGHIGTWTLLAKSVFPNAAIHIFEPLQVHIQELEKNLCDLKDIFIHQYALGNVNKETQINLSTRSDSSSILSITHNMKKYFGQEQVGTEMIQIKPAKQEIDSGVISPPDLIKIDVQGYEIEALKGFGDNLNSPQYLIIEVSFIEFYTGQPLFADIVTFLNEKGFRFHAFGKSTPLAMPLVQTDVLFKRVE